MRIAIIGSGISGLTAAYLLNKQHDITLFESADRLGGHTATVSVPEGEHTQHIDTGFIVFNDWTYPNFIRLMSEIGVASKPTEMSFSVRCENTGLEYGGNNLNSLFAQRRNIFSPTFIGMLRDILRFNKEAIAELDSGQISEHLTLGEYLQSRGYGEKFVSHYLIPMGSAIWSSTQQEMLHFPLLFFVRFFKNHGLLSVNNRPQWRVIEGGSSSYIEPLIESFRNKIRLESKISKVDRHANGVTLHFASGQQEQFDQVVFACHSNQAQALLGDISELEKAILGAIPYRVNEVVLHTDSQLLPKAKRAWSSWNYHLGSHLDKPATLSYNMNILQDLKSDNTYVVTLNNAEQIEPKSILRRFYYDHPVFTLEGMKAQQRWSEINGVNNTWFCGAYWRNGFHEDGCWSGIRVAEGLGCTW
ncbi:NAD(P)/FAD-dependent oxidoreductase [Marinomonas epiphytica]